MGRKRKCYQLSRGGKRKKSMKAKDDDKEKEINQEDLNKLSANTESIQSENTEEEINVPDSSDTPQNLSSILLQSIDSDQQEGSECLHQAPHIMMPILASTPSSKKDEREGMEDHTLDLLPFTVVEEVTSGMLFGGSSLSRHPTLSSEMCDSGVQCCQTNQSVAFSKGEVSSALEEYSINELPSSVENTNKEFKETINNPVAEKVLKVKETETCIEKAETSAALFTNDAATECIEKENSIEMQNANGVGAASVEEVIIRQNSEHTEAPLQYSELNKSTSETNCVLEAPLERTELNEKTSETNIHKTENVMTECNQLGNSCEDECIFSDMLLQRKTASRDSSISSHTNNVNISHSNVQDNISHSNVQDKETNISRNTETDNLELIETPSADNGIHQDKQKHSMPCTDEKLDCNQFEETMSTENSARFKKKTCIEEEEMEIENENRVSEIVSKVKSQGEEICTKHQNQECIGYVSNMVLQENVKLQGQLVRKDETIRELEKSLMVERENSALINENVGNSLKVKNQEIVSLKEHLEYTEQKLTVSKLESFNILKEKENGWRVKLENEIKETNTLRSYLRKLEDSRLLLRKELGLVLSYSNDADLSQEVERVCILNGSLLAEQNSNEKINKHLMEERSKSSSLAEAVILLKEKTVSLERSIDEERIKQSNVLREMDNIIKENNSMKKHLELLENSKALLRQELGLGSSKMGGSDFGQEIESVRRLSSKLLTQKQRNETIKKDLREEKDKSFMLEQDIIQTQMKKEKSNSGTQTVDVQIQETCSHVRDITKLKDALQERSSRAKYWKEHFEVERKKKDALFVCLKKEYNVTLDNLTEQLSYFSKLSDKYRDKMKNLEDVIQQYL